MSGDRYYIQDQHACYFLTFTIVDWVDIFSRQAYKDIIVESMNYCVSQKGWKIYSWIIMSNHMHLICQVGGKIGLSDIIRDFKKFTSKKIIATINDIPESRRVWLLNKFAYKAKVSGRAENFKVWTDDNHAICLDGTINAMQKIEYIHNNPVKAGIDMKLSIICTAVL